MVQILKYSEVAGPYFFMILVVFTISCAIWLISELKKTTMQNRNWFVKRNSGNYRKVVIH